MIALSQMAERVEDCVFEDGLRGEDQMPVKVDLPVISAADEFSVFVAPF